jgi:hypothetical protein
MKDNRTGSREPVEWIKFVFVFTCFEVLGLTKGFDITDKT